MPLQLRTQESQPVTGELVLPDFRATYQCEFAYVCNALQRLGIQRTELQDLTHDVFATAYRRWSTYDATRPVRPWLFGIAYRVVLDFRRKFQNHREFAVASPHAVEFTTAEDKVAARQARDIALRILDSMELEQRAVFVMFELEGHSAAEIAEAVSIPLNTAYSRLRLARKHFNDAVAELQRKEART
jgi:RNA polymerase sigma-70 factor (ECF subfamily)